MDELRAGPFSILVEDLDHPEGVVWSPGGGALRRRRGRADLRGHAGRRRPRGRLHGRQPARADHGRRRSCLCVRLRTARGRPGGSADGRRRGLLRVGADDTPKRVGVRRRRQPVRDRLRRHQGGRRPRPPRSAPGGERTVWSEDAPRYPNGICLSADGPSCWSSSPTCPASRAIPILADGARRPCPRPARPPRHGPGRHRAGRDGAMYVACYRPTGSSAPARRRVERARRRLGGHRAERADQPRLRRRRARRAGDQSVGETQLALGPADVPGLPLRMPEVP